MPRSPTGWPAWPSTACSSSSGASRPGTGRWRRSASTASSGWTQAGELDQIRAGHERWCRLAVAALGRTGTADIDEAWCARFDRIVDDVGAALAWSAGDETRRAQAAELAAELAGLLFVRGRPAQAQRRYEQAAELAATATERAAYLRLAAGAAASRFAGDEALRLFRMAADAALTGGRPGRRGAGSGDDGDVHQPRAGDHGHAALAAEADALVAEARALSDGSPLVQAAIARGDGFGVPPGSGDARRVVELAERAGDGIVHSIALDQLTLACLVDDDIAEAVRIARRRLELLDTLAVGPLSGFEFADGHLMAAEVDLAAGDLAAAAAHAEALARLPFYRDEDHLAMSRRLLVDALAGHFDDVVRTGERFRAGWERAGRPVAPNLARASYAVAMVHGMRGDDERRAAWVRLTIDLGVDPEQLAGCRLGWPRCSTACSRSHRDDPAAAVRRLAADIDDPEPFRPMGSQPWRPWYAALWAEAAVLDRHPDAAARIERSRHAARDNPIAAAMVERAAAIAAGDRDEARPPRDHLRPARLPLPAGTNRPDRGRAARPAPVCVNAENRAGSARMPGTARRTPSPFASSAAPEATMSAIRSRKRT